MRAPVLVDIDAALLAAAADGSQAAWSELHATYAPRLLAYVRTMDGAADPEDIVQSVWLQVMTELSTLRDLAAFDSWVRTIARRTVYRTTRAVRREQSLARGPAASEVVVRSPEELWLEAEDADRARRAVDSLGGRRRELISGRYIGESTAADLADRLGWTTGSVQVELTRAKKALREAYDRLPVLVPVPVWRLFHRWRAAITASSEALVVIAALAATLAPAVGPGMPVPALHTGEGRPPQAAVTRESTATSAQSRPADVSTVRVPVRNSSEAGAHRRPTGPAGGSFDDLVVVDGLGHTGFYDGDYEEFDEPDVYVGSSDSVEVRYWVFEDVPVDRPAGVPHLRLSPEDGVDAPTG